MGCWNKTCGLTRLPIFAGEDTYVFALKQNPSLDDRCYATAFWEPMLMPFYAKYDDYGGGEEESGFYEFVVKLVAEELIEQEQGENTSHDIPVKKEGFGITQFFEAVHENRLFGSSWDGKPVMIDFVMMRKASVDYILEHWERETYVGRGKGDRPEEQNNSYIHYKFADVLADIPKAIERIEKAAKEPVDIPDDFTEEEKAGLSQLCKLDLRGLYCVFDRRRDENKAGIVLASLRNFDRFWGTYELERGLIDLIKSGDHKRAAEAIKDILVGYYINAYMETTRINWAPAGHEGSQSGFEENTYEVLAAAILQGKKEADERWGEDE